MDEEFLYVRDTSSWNTRDQGTVVTDWGITCIPDNENADQVIAFSWENIHHVEYISGCLFFFTNAERTDQYEIHISHFVKGMSDDMKPIAGAELARTFSDMAATQESASEEDAISEVVDRFYSLREEGKEDEALEFAISFRKDTGYVTLTPDLAMLLHKKGQTNQALQLLDDDFNGLPEDNLFWKSMLAYYKYSLLERIDDNEGCRKICQYVIKHVPADLTRDDGVVILEDAKQDFKKYEDVFVNSFLQRPYNQRKLIVPVESYTDLSQKTLSVLDINYLPAINFPMGHPVANQLYVGHPYLPAKYIPFENYELELIEDKVREFCQVMQYLGATEIDIECINSSSNNQYTHINQKASGGVNYKVASVQGSGERDRTNKFIDDISQSINLHQKFYPKAKPSLPKDLVWYPNEPSWQRLYKQRMQGAIREHEERIETKKSQVVENSELKKISAEVKWLFLQANGNWEQSMGEKFEAHENAILAIHVKFAPIESLQGETVSNGTPSNASASVSVFSETEKEYIEELKACLEEDEEISSRERRLLNRLRDRLGISEARANELEESLKKPQLTEDEQEYYEEYKACLEDGNRVSEKERRLLEKLRKMLGISEDRAKEIECL
ncbi:MAG: hypothetical protein MR919_03620 [Parabacteroides sp.]|nr:hypothetical protein [Parabacteroides sp.]